MMLPDYSVQQEVLHSPFSIKTHSETFINYLEVIIDKDGQIYYAVPSHQEFMINQLLGNKYESRSQLYSDVPESYYFDMTKWLSENTEMIAVWTYKYEGEANHLQKEALQTLKNNGLYKGEI